MCNKDLVCNSDLNLVFDDDYLASFIWIHRLDILETLYKGRMYVPQIIMLTLIIIVKLFLILLG